MGIDINDKPNEAISEDPSVLRSRVISCLAEQGEFTEEVRNAFMDWVKGNLDQAKKSRGQEVSQTPEWLHMNLLAVAKYSSSKEDIIAAYCAWNDAERDRARDSGDHEAGLWFEVRLAFTQMMMNMPEEARNTLATARDLSGGFRGSPDTPSLYDHICTVMEILGWKDAQPDPYG